jgi:hypothetical protein
MAILLAPSQQPAPPCFGPTALSLPNTTAKWGQSAFTPKLEAIDMQTPYYKSVANKFAIVSISSYFDLLRPISTKKNLK